MLDELKEEEIVNKVGGRFKLSTLIQKRMVALTSGARPLVNVPGGDRLAIVIAEILDDLIYLDVGGEVATRNDTMMANLPGSVLGSFGVPQTFAAPARRNDDD